MSQNVNIITAQNVQLEYEPAAVGDRILATLIDSIIQFSYWALMVFVFFSLLGLEDHFDRSDVLSTVIVIIIIIIIITTMIDTVVATTSNVLGVIKNTFHYCLDLR